MKRVLVIGSILFLLLVSLFSCKKTPDIPSGNKIEYGVTGIDSTSYFYAIIRTQISSFGVNEVADHGHCWSESKSPTIENNHSSLGALSSPGSFISELDSLKNNTIYYCRPYIITISNIVYGAEQEFRTLKVGRPSCDSTSISTIFTTGATFTSAIVMDSGYRITERGFCWDTTELVTLDAFIDTTQNGSGKGVFSAIIENLQEGKNYTVRSYAINALGTSYGKPKSFSTVPIVTPTVITNIATDIGFFEASTGGAITDDGNGVVSSRGVCWSLNNSPTLENSIGQTTDGTGIGEYISHLSDLIEHTTYYYRAYATNEKGTGYGDVLTFTTQWLALPEITTSEVLVIDYQSASSGGTVVSEGNGTVNSRGVCLSHDTNPSLDNNIGVIYSGTGLGVFECTLSNLLVNTTYYTCAFATNEKGTAYGQVYEFTTTPYGFTDPRDGQFYLMVDIGSQTMMAENLNYDAGTNWCYDNDPLNCDLYGKLYDWNTVMNGESSSDAVPSGVRGVCPSGWHLPSDAEWKVLETYLGLSEFEIDNTGLRGTTEGGKLKQEGLEYWLEPNAEATNETGFSALPGGIIDTDLIYEGESYAGYWWTTTNKSGTFQWARALFYNNGKIHRWYYPEQDGLSVRCFKD